MARIHRRNLINFGVLPLLSGNFDDYDRLEQDSILVIEKPIAQLKSNNSVKLLIKSSGESINLRSDLSADEIEVLEAGGMINQVREKYLSNEK
ncbi:hypothetical protein P3339_17750 [Microbulbifer sp. MLAF003]|uniref:hypothetical protein n=1 Tax=Microbulbifer sp. MLAF003 TaxID=3032582 RepID=UPI0024AD958D|nr:hypothetical protein [Microbulbifer sp. MLAF003]WHI50274.1 hypothetical protein P3339_17750 [Microbulbifer sp. MLAF003]